MKIFLLLSLLLGSFSYGLAQSSPPLKVRETDGSPTKSGINTLIVPNGSLSVTGTTATFNPGFTIGSSGTVVNFTNDINLTRAGGNPNNVQLKFGVPYVGFYLDYAVLGVSQNATAALGWYSDADTRLATGRSLVFSGSATYPFNDPDVGFTRPSAGIVRVTNASTGYGQLEAGKFSLNAVAFASLGTPSNGTLVYCSDCTIANPCAGSGTGALAKRLNGVWVCN
jgi:hypothetical protein